jgi:hypothetical protein
MRKSTVSIMVTRRCSEIEFISLALIIAASSVFFCGCFSGDKSMSPNWSKNHEELLRIADVPSMDAGSAIEREALARFSEFYQEYSIESITSGVRTVYATDAWFGDPFKIVKGIDEVEHYFLAMAKPVKECSFAVHSAQRSDKDYYFRWSMVLVSKAAEKERIETIGMSHVRYNSEGKIIFQQDYWDTGAMFERMPVVGFWTRFAKRRIESGLRK